MSDLNPCPKCGGTPSEIHLLTVWCTACGARTENFTGKGGRFQREYEMAREAWNAGAVNGEGVKS